MNEWQKYDQQDKHQIAFQSLLNRRGKEIAQRLGHQDALQIGACLKCHAIPDPGVARPNPARLSDGVTCVGCHGAFADWVEIHPRSFEEPEGVNRQVEPGEDDWIKLDRKQKERDYGMTDLWDPVRRTEICASCHIGSYAQGKVVTHAMYAAGHPPLPGFEPATFSDAQPRHWEYLHEKTPERLSRLKTLRPRNLEQTQLIVVGSLVSLRESMNLFADQAEANKPDPVGAQWPDFARFDCYACHHELQARDGASWRQVRRRDGQPGRPTPPEWPQILIWLGIEATGPQQSSRLENQLKQQLAAFHASMRLGPFGNSKSIVSTARNVAEWADSLVQCLNHTMFDQALARQLLARLCKTAGETIPDYDSARQIAWAFRAIYRESVPEGHHDAAIERALASLEAELTLNLPPERKAVTIETALPERLRSAAGFNPTSFQARFGIIAERLAKRAPVPPQRR
jgi:hypothetical protein